MKNIVILLLVAGIVGCSGKNAPSAGNFEAAINAKISSEKLCRGLGALPPPYERDRFVASLAQVAPAYSAHIKSALSQNKAKAVRSLIRPGENASDNTELFQVLRQHELIYGFWREGSGFLGSWEYAFLTEKAMANYSEVNRDMEGVFARLCYADRKVGKVLKWSEPADAFGKKITSVKYTIQPTNVAEWAKPFADKDAAEVHEITLVLTNEGWSADD